MRDRRYLLSLAASVAAAALALAGLFLFVTLTGWPGAFALAAVPAAFLGWFYLGPRPDLAPKAGRDPGGSADA
ncbi:MAG: hypothetical protein ACM31I_11485 [Deltaproteobacteria bacterium]